MGPLQGERISQNNHCVTKPLHPLGRGRRGGGGVCVGNVRDLDGSERGENGPDRLL